MAIAAARLLSTKVFSTHISSLCSLRAIIPACKMSNLARGGRLPDGVYPTMITPMLNDEKKSVDWEGLDILTEWFIKSGVAGLFTVCLSSEMFHLSNEERLQVAQRVVDKAAGRVPVVAGATFEGNLEEQAELMKSMGRITSATVIITNQIARMEDSDEVWLANAQKLLDMTGDIPLGLYETPVPKVRSLTPAMMTWAAKTGRFVFHKDTSLHVDRMLEKLRTVQAVPDTPLKFYTAKIQFLKTLLDNGGNGFSGVTINFMPWPVVWLCNAECSKQLEEKRTQVQQLLSLTDRTIANKYPTSAKYYLNKYYSVPFQPVSRMADVVINDQDAQSLQAMKDHIDEVCAEVGIVTVKP